CFLLLIACSHVRADIAPARLKADNQTELYTKLLAKLSEIRKSRAADADKAASWKEVDLKKLVKLDDWTEVGSWDMDKLIERSRAEQKALSESKTDDARLATLKELEEFLAAKRVELAANEEQRRKAKEEFRRKRAKGNELIPFCPVEFGSPPPAQLRTIVAGIALSLALIIAGLVLARRAGAERLSPA
ncbi:MAG TPA: hypothetical protein VEK08_00520, partial [Planctomycetota bacterium]|nr:hypothetical protein [Planctomycetota bacterium]